MNLTDWIGSIGVFQILLAYVLNITGTLDKDSLTFKLLNFFGASLACTASVLMNYIPFIVLEGVWAFVSLVSLFQKRKQSSD
ncbi:CBU_0592 family membrane protein [Flammeovirga agarivorans]|uniref:CBU-0592-like domain-containing protein n=1 Tax=Flammeovirga agarivorans TaxID=2726742 RepID=A0A7X8SHR8_9BACT|nr:hypothetical protein [Flammeovirga agarivorans]NLR90461.1 hypothetical protein [Flammeovirga agarivorans]